MKIELDRSDVCRLMRACTILDFAFEEPGASDTKQWLYLHDKLNKQLHAWDAKHMKEDI